MTLTLPSDPGTGPPGAVLITGATGYIGTAVAQRYAAAGWTLAATIRPASDCRELVDRVPGIRLHEIDGSPGSMTRVIDTAAPDLVLHLAARVTSQTTPLEVAAILEANIVLGTQLVEAMIKSGVRRLINTGTFAQYGPDGSVFPATLYGASKQAFEEILAWYIDDQMAVTTLYPLHVYGASDPNEQRLMGLLRKAIRTGRPLALSPGEQLIDFVHVEDVAEAYLVAGQRLMARETPGAHERFWIASGDPISLRSLVDQIQALTKRSVPVEWGGRPYRPREVMSPWVGEALPGWKPRIQRTAGLMRVFGGLV
jgi:nucleoside-diphosphate-sugar epimerase